MVKYLSRQTGSARWQDWDKAGVLL